MDDSLVRINRDDADKIAGLYGVGPRLAKRIIAYRAKYGYFNGPESLAKVEGISLGLATTLSPHLDWSIPATTEPRSRDWFTIAIALIGLFLVFRITIDMLPSRISSTLRAYNSRSSLDWLVISYNISAITVGIISIITFILVILEFSTRNMARSMAFSRAKIICIGFSVLAEFVIYILIFSGYYFFVKGGVLVILRDQSFMTGLIEDMMWIIMVMPLLLVFLNPTLVKSKWVGDMYDIAVVISSPIIAWYIYANLEHLSLSSLILEIMRGIFLFSSAVIYLGGGGSIFKTNITFLDVALLNRKTQDAVSWMKWVNIHIPDPEQQKQLKEALNHMHRPSKFKTIGSAIVIGASLWLLQTVFSAIIELYAQKWWSSIMCVISDMECGS